MKSNIHQKYTLSVGMIVKNEEKYLDKCLSALKPLLDAVPSELVIVDTGSTDSTVDIAKKYTDKVYYFEWIDDFSAARNFSLQKCNGQWFMWIDADQILDTDISDMAQFFTNEKLNKKYQSANFTEHNYTDEELKNYSVFTPLRIVRLNQSIKFKDKIHENINYSLPLYSIKTIVHHHGYGDKKNEKKASRNLPLLLEKLEKNPDDYRIISHIINETFDTKKQFIVDRIDMLAKCNDSLKHVLYVQFALNFYIMREFELILKVTDMYSERFGDTNNALAMDLYFARTEACWFSDKYEETIECADEYFRLYNMYESGSDKLDTSELIYTSIYSLGKEYFNMVNTRQKRARYKISTSKYKTLAQEYLNLLKTKDEAKISQYERELEQKFYDEPDSHLFCENFSAENQPDTGFFELVNLIKTQERTPLYRERLEKFLAVMPTDGFSCALILAIEYGADVLPAVLRMSETQILEFAVNTAKRERHFAELVLRYIRTFPVSQFVEGGLKPMFWLTCVLENALNSADDSFKSQYGAELKQMYDTAVAACNRLLTP